MSTPTQEELTEIWENFDAIMLTMRPQHVSDASMDGKFPCWLVWLPDDGRTTRKHLRDAVLDFVRHSARRGVML